MSRVLLGPICVGIEPNADIGLCSIQPDGPVRFGLRLKAGAAPEAPPALQIVPMELEGDCLTVEVPLKIEPPERWCLDQRWARAFLGALAKASSGQDWRVFHGAATCLNDERAVLILGASGAGKSTLVRRLGWQCLGDEVVAVHCDERGLDVAGTIIPGELQAAHLERCPLSCVVIPGQHGVELSVEQLRPSEALSILLGCLVRCDEDALAQDLKWLKGWLESVPIFRVHWDRDRHRPRQALLDTLERA